MFAPEAPEEKLGGQAYSSCVGAVALTKPAVLALWAGYLRVGERTHWLWLFPCFPVTLMGSRRRDHGCSASFPLNSSSL